MSLLLSRSTALEEENVSVTSVLSCLVLSWILLYFFLSLLDHEENHFNSGHRDEKNTLLTTHTQSETFVPECVPTLYT